MLELESPVRNDVAQSWRIRARDGRYAQIAVAGKAFPEAIGSADLHRPFKVTGRFSDKELLEIVAYVRSSPRKAPIPDDPDGTSRVEVPDQLNGRLAVVQLAR